LVDRRVIVVAPEVLHAFNLRAQLLQLRLIHSIVASSWLLLLLLLLRVFAGLPVKVDIPVVLRGQRAHGLQEVAFRIVALLGGRGHARRVRIGALRQPREAAREE